jgi:hypothetical protein
MPRRAVFMFEGAGTVAVRPDRKNDAAKFEVRWTYAVNRFRGL